MHRKLRADLCCCVLIASVALCGSVNSSPSWAGSVQRLEPMPGGELSSTVAGGFGPSTAISSQWVPGVPPALSGAAIAYSSGDGYLVLFGGQTGVGSAQQFTNATWVLSQGQWYNVTRAEHQSPEARFGASMTYDSTDGSLVLFGGAESSGMMPNETWTFKGGQWENLTSSLVGQPPAGRTAPAMADDPSDAGIVLFGGIGPTCGPFFCPSSNDTWVLAHGRWNQLHPTLSPTARISPMTYDSESGTDILFGGRTNNAYYADGTWSFHNGVWTNLTSSVGSPLLPVGASQCWDPLLSDDPADGYMVLTESCGPGFSMTGTSATWSFHQGWTRLDQDTGRGPLTTESCMTFDESAGEVVLEGGYVYQNYSVLRQDWRFSHGLWTQYFLVTLQEVGLPTGTNWTGSLNSSSAYGTSSNLSFEEPTGSYGFSVGQAAGMAPTPAVGTLSVADSNLTLKIRFAPIPANPTWFLEPPWLWGFVGVFALALALALAALHALVTRRRRRLLEPTPVTGTSPSSARILRVADPRAARIHSSA